MTSSRSTPKPPPSEEVHEQGMNIHKPSHKNALPGGAIFSAGGGSGDGIIAPEVSATITKHTLSESLCNTCSAPDVKSKSF